jgi:CDP-diacylglycerol--glycerol-3-phosphate 3-phosphatidyltransferase
MKKHIANIITGSRIVLSLPLLFIPLSSAWFYVLYLFCGLTDMIDGTIARKTGAVSKIGAKLDAVADFVFMFVCWVKIFPLIHIPVWLWVWIIVVVLIKIFNITLVFIQKKKLISIHSVLNKITGFALFLLPLSLTFVETTYSIATICVLATIAATQEVCFLQKGKMSYNQISIC